MQTVLIVEDEKMIRQGLRVMIQRSGVPVEHILECNNGMVALEVLKNHKVDVMFTDIRMPKMDGIELVQRMQELPEKPLVVAISGYDDFSYAVEMLRNGVREYLLKPVERDKMREVLLKLEEELQTFQGEADGKLPYPDYYVCCLEQNVGVPEQQNGCISLEKAEEGRMLLIDSSCCRQLLETQLQDSCAGVSGLHHGIGQLRSAWQEAVHARKEAFCLCRRCGGEPEEKLTEEKSGLPTVGEAVRRKAALSEEEIHRLVQQIGTERVKEAADRLRQAAGCVKLGNAGPEELEQFVGKLLAEIQSVYQSALAGQTEMLHSLSHPYGFTCLDEFAEELIGWLFFIHEKIDEQFDECRNRLKMEAALQYVQEHFGDDLNMAVVSNHISMNYSLFSYEFKQYTGKNFVSYLKELRMEEAKKLLVSTQLRVNEISQQIGYENEKHFMKTFKKECGVSPTEYRKNMGLSG